MILDQSSLASFPCFLCAAIHHRKPSYIWISDWAVQKYTVNFYVISYDLRFPVIFLWKLALYEIKGASTDSQNFKYCNLLLKDTKNSALLDIRAVHILLIIKKSFSQFIWVFERKLNFKKVHADFWIVTYRKVTYWKSEFCKFFRTI